MFNLKNRLNNQDPLLMKKVMIRNILSLQSALDTIVHPKHFLYSSATLILSDATPLCRMLCLSCPHSTPSPLPVTQVRVENKSQVKVSIQASNMSSSLNLQKKKTSIFCLPWGRLCFKALDRQSAI